MAHVEDSHHYAPRNDDLPNQKTETSNFLVPSVPYFMG